MTNLVQFLLIVVISTLTFLIAFVAVQVFQVLHEARIALKKFNALLENTHTLSESAVKPIVAMNQFFSEVKGMVSTTENQIIGDTPDRVMTTVKSSHESVSTTDNSKRFFRRAGAMLRPRN